MTTRIHKGGAWIAPISVSVKKGGSWKLVSKIFIKKSAAWIEVYPGTGTPGGLTFTASMANANVSGSRSGAGDVTSNAAQLNTANGTAPITYAWTKISGTTLTVNTPTASTTTFSKTLANAEEVGAVYRCTATDNLGAVAFGEVTITLTSVYLPPPPPPPPPPSLNVNCNPSSMTVQGFGDQILTSPSVSVSVSGGNGSYTYSWTGSFMSITSPASPSTTFQKYMAQSQTFVIYAYCQVTDTAGVTGTGSCAITWTTQF